MSQNLYALFVCQSPKVLDFNEKRLQWESVVRDLMNKSQLQTLLVNKRAGWKENLKNLSEHALLLETSEYKKKSYLDLKLDFFLEKVHRRITKSSQFE